MSLNGNLNKSQFMEELQQKVEHITMCLRSFFPLRRDSRGLFLRP